MINIILYITLKYFSYNTNVIRLTSRNPFMGKLDRKSLSAALENEYHVTYVDVAYKDNAKP